MRLLLWLSPLALGLAACMAYPSGPDARDYDPELYPYPQPLPPGPPGPLVVDEGPNAATYRAIGTEPFWDLQIGADLIFTDRGNNVSVVQRTPVPINGVAGEIYRTQRIEVNIVHARCSDGMSERTYPDRVQVRVDGRSYEGCGAPISFFASVDERGNPRPAIPPPTHGTEPPAPPLDRTRWRVVAINGRPTPPNGNFTMEFTSGRLSATFGCNNMGAGYTQSGATLDAGPVTATEMACPDMSWERDGGKVLAPDMSVRLLGPNRVLLQNSAGSIEMVRR